MSSPPSEFPTRPPSGNSSDDSLSAQMEEGDMDEKVPSTQQPFGNAGFGVSSPGHIRPQSTFRKMSLGGYQNMKTERIHRDFENLNYQQKSRENLFYAMGNNNTGAKVQGHRVGSSMDFEMKRQINNLSSLSHRLKSEMRTKNGPSQSHRSDSKLSNSDNKSIVAQQAFT